MGIEITGIIDIDNIIYMYKDDMERWERKLFLIELIFNAKLRNYDDFNMEIIEKHIESKRNIKYIISISKIKDSIIRNLLIYIVIISRFFNNKTRLIILHINVRGIAALCITYFFRHRIVFPAVTTGRCKTRQILRSKRYFRAQWNRKDAVGLFTLSVITLVKAEEVFLEGSLDGGSV